MDRLRKARTLLNLLFLWTKADVSRLKKTLCMVPKAGLEPARISTVDFESTASTDFATSALKRYAENVVDYTCRTPPCKRQLARTSLSAEIFSIAYRDV